MTVSSRPAAGGLGILIGDGQLNYRPEQILEAYYAYSPNKWATLTFDYQFIDNPGYNADRDRFRSFQVGCTRSFECPDFRYWAAIDGVELEKVS